MKGSPFSTTLLILLLLPNPSSPHPRTRSNTKRRQTHQNPCWNERVLGRASSPPESLLATCDRFRRSRANIGDTSRVHAVVRKLQDRRCISFVTLGASVDPPAVGWLSWLKKLLDADFPCDAAAGHAVHDLGGAPAVSVLQSTPLPLGGNTASFGDGSLDAGGAPTQSTLIHNADLIVVQGGGRVEEPATIGGGGSGPGTRVDDVYTADLERTLRTLLALPSRPGIVWQTAAWDGPTPRPPMHASPRTDAGGSMDPTEDKGASLLPDGGWPTTGATTMLAMAVEMATVDMLRYYRVPHVSLHAALSRGGPYVEKKVRGDGGACVRGWRGCG
jgi:hypothetical protein